MPLSRSRSPEILPHVNLARAELGLGPIDDIGAVDGVLRVGVVPERWYPTELRSATLRCYRPTYGRPTVALDAELAGLAVDGPLVVAGLGTNTALHPADRPLFEPIVEALGSLPCTAVVALGSTQRLAAWTGPRRSNVRLVSFVRQRLLLRTAAAFITHAGFSSVTEGLLAGVPMLAIPVMAEQPRNAARLSELGLGVTLPLEQADPASIAAATTRLLTENAFTTAARAIQRESLGLPGFDHLATELAEAVGSR